MVTFQTNLRVNDLLRSSGVFRTDATSRRFPSFVVNMTAQIKLHQLRRVGKNNSFSIKNPSSGKTKLFASHITHFKFSKTSWQSVLLSTKKFTKMLICQSLYTTACLWFVGVTGVVFWLPSTRSQISIAIE